VIVPGALHLKSVCTALDEHTILADATRVDLSPFQVRSRSGTGGRMDGSECLAGSTEMFVCTSGFRKTIELLQQRGIEVRTVDISEFLKAEAG